MSLPQRKMDPISQEAIIFDNDSSIELSELKSIFDTKQRAAAMDIPLHQMQAPEVKKVINDCFNRAFRQKIVYPDLIVDAIDKLKNKLIEDKKLEMPVIRNLVNKLHMALEDFEQTPVTLHLINQYLINDNFLEFQNALMGFAGPYQQGLRFFGEHHAEVARYTNKFRKEIDKKISVEAKRVDRVVQEKKGDWNATLEKLILAEYKDPTMVSFVFALLGYLQNQWQEKVELITHSSLNFKNKDKISLELIFKTASKEIEDMYKIIKKFLSIESKPEDEKTLMKQKIMGLMKVIHSYPNKPTQQILKDVAQQLEKEMSIFPELNKKLDQLRKDFLEMAAATSKRSSFKRSF